MSNAFSTMTIEEKRNYLKNNPWNFYFNDPMPGIETIKDRGTDLPIFNLNKYVTEQSDEFTRRRERIDEIGAMINLVHVPFGWVGIEEYNFKALDHLIENTLKDHPDRYMIPRFMMDAPLDWCRKHPEELCIFFEGPTDMEEIKALVGTQYQVDTCSSCTGPEKIGRQSFSSRLWQQDAVQALRMFIEHCEASPYADRIIGYMPMYGECGGELLWWGFQTTIPQRRGDFGVSHTRRFFEWALDKYGTLDALRSAWNLPELTAKNLPMPTPFDAWSYPIENWREVKDLSSFLLLNDQRQVDWNWYHSETNFEAIELFGRVIKEMTGKITGCFYGYTLLPTAGYCGQLLLNRAIESPWFDFYSAPKGYHYCQAGDPGESQAPALSIARKKIWIEENDMRSYHKEEYMRKHFGRSDTYSPKTESESITCFWRELFRALTGNYGFWWMDINGLSDDWYTDEVLIAMFKKQADFFKKWSPVPRKRTAEILWIEDDDSIGHSASRWSLLEGIRLRLNRELRQCGAPMDRYRMEDLLEMDLSQYKFIIFQHAFVLPKEKWDKILTRIRPDAHILWNYAAGLLDPNWNPANQKAVTGFHTFETPSRLSHEDTYRHIYNHASYELANDYPHLSLLTEENQEIIQTSPDGYILTARIARDKGKNIFAADMTLRTPLLRKLMEDAGVTFPAPINCSVQADDKLLGFFPRYDTVIHHSFSGTWRNVITDEILTGTVEIPIHGKGLAIFEKLE